MPLTIQQAIEAFIASIPNAPFPDTINAIKVDGATLENSLALASSFWR